MKEISLNTLMQQAAYEPVYILNTTKGGDRGEVFFTVPNANGTKEDHVRIPNTYIPVCLTDQVTRRQLLDSSSFRRAISLGAITLLQSDDAEETLKDPENAGEVSRVREVMASATIADVQEGLGESAEAANPLPAPVMAFVELMESYGTDELALDNLKNLGVLETHEYKAIWEKAKSISFTKTAKYAQEKGKKK